MPTLFCYRGRTGLALAAFLAGANLCAPGARAQASAPGLVRLPDGGSTATIVVPAGKTRTLDSTTSYIDLVVGDPDIADAMPLTDHSFYIHGKKAGATTISAYDASKNLVGSLEVEVGADIGRLNADLRRELGGSRVHATSVNGHIMMKGVAQDAVSLDRALAMAKEYDPAPLNAMTLSAPQQVMLQVRFVEISRNASRELGASWNLNSKSVIGAAGGVVTNNTPFGAILTNILGHGVSADVAIDALEQKGVARRLADPDLVAMSGQTASFLAGGEFPFPVQGENNTVSVSFKQYGVGLSFTPIVLADGLIDLKISPEVSELDTTNTVTTAGVTVPSLVVRRVNTEIELKDGQSFAIAGLLQTQNSEMLKQLPWIGDVPVLGTLFRDAAYSKNETDLAVIVTPSLVRPSKPNEPLHTPFDSIAPANDVDRFLLGRQEVSPAEQLFSNGRPSHVADGHMLQIDDGAGHAQ